jgi:hypothetical protein
MMPKMGCGAMFPAVIVFITFDPSILKFTRFQAIFRSESTEKYGRETEIMIARAASENPFSSTICREIQHLLCPQHESMMKQ